MYLPTVLDLFSGCGGMSWGLHKAGFKILAGIDNSKTALVTFKHNHPEALPICADITKLNPSSVLSELNLEQGELDCIIGGPPCQGFSKNVPAQYRFLDDHRNQLFLYYIAFVEIFRPKIVIMENVAEIYNAYSGRVRNEIETSLKNLGYKVFTKVVYAPDYGVPQRRRRCIFFASRTGIQPFLPDGSFAELPSKTLFGEIRPYRSAWSAISDLPVIQNGEGYEPMVYGQTPENDYQVEMRKDSHHIYDHIAKNLKPTQLARISAIKAGEGINELPPELKPKSGYSGAYGRLDYTMIAPTITRWVFHPGSGRYSHPRENRLLTIREAARIQSFSDDFRFRGSYVEKASQIGNAVPPLLMFTFSQKIRETLGC